MENNLLIEFESEENFWNKIRKNIFPVQGKPFKFSLKATNTGSNVFPGATIKNIIIRPAQPPTYHLIHNIPGEFEVRSLNPNESEKIYIAQITTLLDGLLWIECQLNPSQQEQTIVAFQRDCGTGQIIDPQTNRWGHEFFMMSSSQVSSNRLNVLVALLTFLMFWDAVFGIKNTIISVLKFLGNFLLLVGSWFVKIN